MVGALLSPYAIYGGGVHSDIVLTSTWWPGLCALQSSLHIGVTNMSIAFLEVELTAGVAFL